MSDLPKLNRTFPEIVAYEIPAPDYEKNMKLKDIIKDNTVEFIRYRKGFLYYLVAVDNNFYEFPVPIEDCGDATFFNNDKAIMFMRYIRKALEDDTFVLTAL